MAKKVLIRWRDAVHRFGWLDDVEHEDDVVETIGFLLSKTKDTFIVAQSVGAGAHAQTIQIPAPMVIEVEELITVKKEKTPHGRNRSAAKTVCDAPSV